MNEIRKSVSELKEMAINACRMISMDPERMGERLCVECSNELAEFLAHMKDKEYYSPEEVADMFGYSQLWQIYRENFHLNMLDFTTDYMDSDRPFCECLCEYLAEHIANEMTKKELSVYLTND